MHKLYSILTKFSTTFLPTGSVSRGHNNWLYRTRLDRVSATNLCYVILFYNVDSKSA